MTRSSDFWDAMAPVHAVTENHFFDLPSLHQILPEVSPPVLVVGAGQGLIVAELRKQGFQCDGVDLSAEMIRYARLRRGLDLIHADAKALPFENGAYRTIIYATGVIDCLSDEAEIRVMLDEGRRLTGPSGNIFVAFYKFSAATEDFIIRLGLLEDKVLKFREVLGIGRLSPVQTMSMVVKHAGVGIAAAARMTFRLWVFSSWKEKRNAFRMQTLFGKAKHVDAFIHAAPVNQAYRSQSEIRNLFSRLAIPIRQWRTSSSCHMVRV